MQVATTPAAETQRPVRKPAGRAVARNSVLQGSFERLNGRRDALTRYQGDVVLVVNSATQFGYIP